MAKNIPTDTRKPLNETDLTKEFRTKTKGSTTLLDKEIGARIRQARQLAGMSQIKLGDGIGVRFQQVQKYEQGVNRVSASTLNDIAKTLGKPIAYFYGQKQENIPPDFSKEELDLVRHYREMAPDRQEVVFRLIAAMRDQQIGPKPEGP